MELITLNKENLAEEHICCAISGNKDVQVSSKKSWLNERFCDGLVFTKGNVRGKCFIEYIPAENAWSPIEAPNYMFIDCFWVSGQYKEQGNANILLESCIKDSKEKKKDGLVVLSSKKKMPYLSDPKFLKYKGFQVADSVDNYYELLYLPFNENSSVPKFKDHIRVLEIDEKGFVLYYTSQCPFNAKYVPLLENVAKEKDIPFKINKIETKAEAQNAPAPFTTYSLFYNGKLLTNELMSDKKFIKIIEAL